MYTFIYRDENGNVGVFEDSDPYELCEFMGWEFLRMV